MSVMSLLIMQSCSELELAWQSLAFKKLGISFACECMKAETTGIITLQGVSFTFSIQAMPHLEVAKFIFCQSDTSAFHSAIHLDFGPTVRGGNQVPAIVKVLLQLGVSLGQALQAGAVFWSPGSIMSGFDYYAEAVSQYADGGAFPALLCIDFDTSDSAIVKSHGLNWLCGQELAFEHTPLTSNIAMRYVVRLVHDLATKGCVDQKMTVPGMMVGETVLLTPDVHNKVLSARLLTAN